MVSELERIHREIAAIERHEAGSNHDGCAPLAAMWRVDWERELDLATAARGGVLVEGN